MTLSGTTHSITKAQYTTLIDLPIIDQDGASQYHLVIGGTDQDGIIGQIMDMDMGMETGTDMVAMTHGEAVLGIIIIMHAQPFIRTEAMSSSTAIGLIILET